MSVSKSALALGAVIAVMGAATLTASSAAAATTTYVVCNRWDECWRVHEHYKNYPAEDRITWHDDVWYQAHQHDAHWRWLNDPADDHGYYDKDGAWHAFADTPPPP